MNYTYSHLKKESEEIDKIILNYLFVFKGVIKLKEVLGWVLLQLDQCSNKERLAHTHAHKEDHVKSQEKQP